MQDLQKHIERILTGLNETEVKNWKYESTKPGTWHAVERKKYIALDIGGSGAFLVDKDSGELFNIKSYGTPDKNKKQKADIGNISTVDPAILWTKRYNYLR